MWMRSRSDDQKTTYFQDFFSLKRSWILPVSLGLTSITVAACIPLDPYQVQEVLIQADYASLDESPLASQAVEVSVTFTGAGLFQGAENCSNPEADMPAVLHQSGWMESSKSQTPFPIENFNSATDNNCRVKQPLSIKDIHGIRIDAYLVATPENCAAFCSTSENTEACLADCSSGDRRILASRDYNEIEVRAFDETLSSGTLTLETPLSFTKLSPRIENTQGPDLRVDGDAARESISFGAKTFDSEDCAVREACVSGPGRRTLLRFDGVIQNLGDQDFILGAAENNSLLDYSSCHGHYHLRSAMRYELLHPETKEVVRVGDSNVIGRKQGFCMMDMQRISGNRPGKYNCSNQGLTSGWADLYDSALDCQWVDITDVAPGPYSLRITVNPDGILQETNLENNQVEFPVQIPNLGAFGF